MDHVDGNSLRLASGEQRDAEAIVVACDAPAAAKLLGEILQPLDRALRVSTLPRTSRRSKNRYSFSMAKVRDPSTICAFPVKWRRPMRR